MKKRISKGLQMEEKVKIFCGVKQWLPFFFTESFIMSILFKVAKIDFFSSDLNGFYEDALF